MSHRLELGRAARLTRVASAIAIGLVLAGGGAAIVSTAGCERPSEDELFVSICGKLGLDDETGDPLSDFRPVSLVLEQRCATLDCHGNSARPLRIYSQQGLRAVVTEPEAGMTAGGTSPTTDFEIEANYRSVCGLEPEVSTQVALGQLDVEELTIVRKPALLEKHKGGIIWEKGKPGDQCLRGWFQNLYEPGEFNATKCQEELQ